ncbi:MAG: hypothetical protein IKJ68_10860 [Clostridia bacterium]|nr:hypothetical protein [Clostridia bacterium]
MKKLKTLIVVLTVLLIAATILINWQYNNIKALYYSQLYANDDIDTLIQNHYNEIDEYLSSNDKYEVRQSTKLEEKLHQSNLITDEEFIDILTGKTNVEQIFGVDINLNESNKFVSPDGSELTTDEIVVAKQEISKNKTSGGSDSGSDSKPNNQSGANKNQQQNTDSGSGKNNQSNNGSSPNKPSGNENITSNPDNCLNNNTNTPTPDTPANTKPQNTGSQNQLGNSSNQTSDEKVSECIARMYVLKSTFESQLDGIYVEAKSYYSSLTPEQRKNAKSEMMKTFYSRATSLESSCDAQVSSVLSELETALVASGESTELVNKIQTAYDEEKSLKKAYYINLYKSH